MAAIVEGNLLICEHDTSDWAERWFILNPGKPELLISVNNTTAAHEVVQLGPGCKVIVQLEASTGNAPTSHTFQLSAQGSIYSLCAASGTDKLKWCRGLGENTDGIFAAEGPVVKFEGYLHKTNPKGSRWDRRWFVLNGSKMELGYAEKPKKRRSGVISLKEKKFWLRGDPTDIQIELLGRKRSPPTTHLFQLVGTNRTYNLCAKSWDEKVAWCNHLAKLVPSLATGPPENQAVVADGSELEGYLYKTNPSTTHWDRRWFVFDPVHMRLRYFESHSSRRDKPRGGVDLSRHNVRVNFDVNAVSIASLKQRTAVPTNHIFQVEVGARTYSLCSDTREELMGWCNALAFACGCNGPTDPVADAAADVLGELKSADYPVPAKTRVGTARMNINQSFVPDNQLLDAGFKPSFSGSGPAAAANRRATGLASPTRGAAPLKLSDVHAEHASSSRRNSIPQFDPMDESLLTKVSSDQLASGQLPHPAEGDVEGTCACCTIS